MSPSQQPPRPPPFVVEPTSAHTHSVIFLHGLGSNGEKFGRELLDTGRTSSGLTLPQLLPGARFIFPTSRRRRSTAFGRSMLTQWFDIACLHDPAHRKELQLQGLAESAREVLELLEQEQELGQIARENIILGGLSQGCATSLSSLLCLNYRIGGFIGMSGYLPFQKDIREAVDGASNDDDNPFSDEEDVPAPSGPTVKAAVFERDLLDLPPADHPSLDNTAYSTPIFLGHGSADPKVPVSLGEDMAGTMKAAGYNVRWKSYQDLGHWYKIPDEIDDIVKFLRSEVGWQVGNA
ncbi:hypothetical protein ACHAQA_009131 [Verticillium albo-atrum]